MLTVGKTGEAGEAMDSTSREKEMERSYRLSSEAATMARPCRAFCPYIWNPV